MRNRSLILVAFMAIALLAPGISFADHNSCDATLTGPRQGRHTSGNTSGDSVLWPPNHKLRTVSIAATNTLGKACNVTITDVRQDEAVDEPGSGNTDPDAANCKNAGNTSTVDLRGERSGLGDGRYYHVIVSMVDPDASGHLAVEDLKVLVPHDQGIKKVWTDQGALFPSYSGATLGCTS